jgi:hypothetical protein
MAGGGNKKTNRKRAINRAYYEKKKKERMKVDAIGLEKAAEGGSGLANACGRRGRPKQHKAGTYWFNFFSLVFM